MCNCRSEIEQKLQSRFVEQNPEATGHRVKLNGYALIFGDQLQEKGCMEFEAVAKYPLKKGGTKEKKTKQNMIFTYCPFCGEKYAA